METNTPISIELYAHKCTDQYTTSALSQHAPKTLGLQGFMPQKV